MNLPIYKQDAAYRDARSIKPPMTKIVTGHKSHGFDSVRRFIVAAAATKPLPAGKI
jgi:hypothetical protein